MAIVTWETDVDIGGALRGWWALLVEWVVAQFAATEKVPEAVPMVHRGDRALLDGRDALVFQPVLAALLGINEAIMIQKVHEWLLHNERENKTTHYIEERWWTYNSYGEWQRNHFTWISEDSVKRLFRKLVGKGIIISAPHRQAKGDSRNFFTLDYGVIQGVVKESGGGGKIPSPPEQKNLGGVQNTPPTTKESTKKESPKKKTIPSTTPPDLDPLPPAAFTDVGGVPVDDLDSGEFIPVTAEAAVKQVDGSDAQPNPSPNSAPPPPLGATAMMLIETMVGDYAPRLTRAFATNLVLQYGEDRVLAVYAYVVADRDSKRPSIHSPVGFMVAELAEDKLGLEPMLYSAPESDPQAGEDETLDGFDVAAYLAQQPPTEERVSNPVWAAAYQQLELQLDRHTFDTWLRKARFVSVEDGQYTVALHSKYACDMCQHRLYRNIKRVLSDVAGQPCEITFVREGQVGDVAA